MLKPKTRRMLAISRKLKVLSILVVICMLFALTGCDEQESTATSETTTEATTQAITAAPTAEATTEATTATPKPTEAPTTTPTTETTTEATTTEATTEAPTEAPSVTVPDVSDVPQDAQAQAEEWTPENGEGGEPENPEQPIDDGYWHEDPEPDDSARISAEQGLAQVQQAAATYGWTVTTYPLGYGSGINRYFYRIYVRVDIASGADELPHSFDGAVSASAYGALYWSERDPSDTSGDINADVFDLDWSINDIITILADWGVSSEEGEGEPQEPDQTVDDVYWHEDTPSVTAADLQEAAESDLAVFSSYLKSNGWSIIDTSVTRATDTQYGIFVHFGNGAGGESWRMVKAETPDGRGIAVGWYQSYGGSPFDISTNYDDYTNGPYGATDFSLD